MKRQETISGRQTSAISRQASREARDDQEQLVILEQRGHGYCKEALRLRERIAKAPSAEEVVKKKKKNKGKKQRKG